MSNSCLDTREKLNFFRFDDKGDRGLDWLAHRLGDLECASQMHVEDGVPVVLGHLAKRDVAKVPSIVDTDCLRAESGWRVPNRDGQMGVERGQ